MKKVVLAVLAAVAAGLLVGGGWGWYKVRRTHWDLSMEDFSYFEKEIEEQQKKAEEAAQGKIKAPRVAVDLIEYDFGVMELNEETRTGSHDFTIVNKGNETLKLKEKDKSCFCTDFSIANHSVPPGESTTCTVTWDGHNSGGEFKQTVVISTNDPQSPEFFFNVRGLYTSPIICSPNHISLNGVSSAEPLTRSFHILGLGVDDQGNPFDCQFSEITVSDPDHFEVTVEKGSLDEMTDSEKQSKVLSSATSLFNGTLTEKPGLSIGSFQELVRFKTNHPKLPYMELMVEGQVAGSVNISGQKYDKHNTGQLVIGTVSSRDTTVETIRLDINDPLLVANAETVKVASKRPEWLQVELTFPEADVPLPVKMIPVTITIPAGSPQENYGGPDLAQTGEIVFAIGEGEKTQNVVLPVNFSVGP